MQGVQLLSVFVTVISLLAFSFAFVFKLVRSLLDLHMLADISDDLVDFVGLQ